MISEGNFVGFYEIKFEKNDHVNSESMRIKISYVDYQHLIFLFFILISRQEHMQYGWLMKTSTRLLGRLMLFLTSLIKPMR
jgi:hypothetical protein